MSFCNKCGAPIPAGSKFCPDCGAPVKGTANTYTYSYGQPDSNNQYNYSQNNYSQNYNANPKPKDSGSWGWGVLGFFIPLAGLVLLIVWSKSKPKCAKAAGIGALISLILGIVGSIIHFIFAMLLVNDVTGIDTQIIQGIDGLETIWVMLNGIL